MWRGGNAYGGSFTWRAADKRILRGSPKDHSRIRPGPGIIECTLRVRARFVGNHIARKQTRRPVETERAVLTSLTARLSVGQPWSDGGRMPSTKLLDACGRRRCCNPVEVPSRPPTAKQGPVLSADQQPDTLKSDGARHAVEIAEHPEDHLAIARQITVSYLPAQSDGVVLKKS